MIGGNLENIADQQATQSKLAPAARSPGEANVPRCPKLAGTRYASKDMEVVITDCQVGRRVENYTPIGGLTPYVITTQLSTPLISGPWPSEYRGGST